MSKPVKKLVSGSVSASVFLNEVKTANGVVERPSVVVQRYYKDREGKDSYAQSFRTEDLPRVSVLLKKVFEEYDLEVKQ